MNLNVEMLRVLPLNSHVLMDVVFQICGVAVSIYTFNQVNYYVVTKIKFFNFQNFKLCMVISEFHQHEIKNDCENIYIMNAKRFHIISRII